jgi:hypothetical protein
MSDDDDGESAFEDNLCVIQRGFVFQVPTVKSSSGYRAKEWSIDKALWSGRVRVVAHRGKCRILLEHPDDDADNARQGLFASCPYDAPECVEPVVDSARYFVLRIVRRRRRLSLPVLCLAPLSFSCVRRGFVGGATSDRLSLLLV